MLGEVGGEVIVNECRVSFWDTENVLELVVSVIQLCENSKNTKSNTLKG